MNRLKATLSTDDFRSRRDRVHFGVIGAAMIFVLAILAQGTRFHELNATLLELDREKQELDEERARLSLRREQYLDPGRIRNVAVDQLGMVALEPEKLHEIREGAGR